MTFNRRSTKDIVRVLIDNFSHDRSVSIYYCLSISLVSKTTINLPFNFMIPRSMVSDSIVCFFEFHEPLVDSIREPNTEEEYSDSRKNHSLPIAVVTIIHCLELFWLDLFSGPCLIIDHLFFLSRHTLFT